MGMGFPLSDAEHGTIKAMIDAQPELVVAAAIQVDWRGSRLIVMAERPGRHGNCIGAAGKLSGDIMRGGEQGFVTNRGRFVGRQEAAEIAVAAGQATPRDGCNGNLFSEDVWNDLDITSRKAIRPEDIF